MWIRLLGWLFQPVYIVFIALALVLYINRDRFEDYIPAIKKAQTENTITNVDLYTKKLESKSNDLESIVLPPTEYHSVKTELNEKTGSTEADNAIETPASQTTGLENSVSEIVAKPTPETTEINDNRVMSDTVQSIQVDDTLTAVLEPAHASKITTVDDDAENVEDEASKVEAGTTSTQALQVAEVTITDNMNETASEQTLQDSEIVITDNTIEPDSAQTLQATEVTNAVNMSETASDKTPQNSEVVIADNIIDPASKQMAHQAIGETEERAIPLPPPADDNETKQSMSVEGEERLYGDSEVTIKSNLSDNAPESSVNTISKQEGDITQTLESDEKHNPYQKAQDETEQTQKRDLLWYHARFFAAQKDYEKSIEYYRLLIETNPHHADAFGEMGNVYLMMGDIVLTISAYLKASELLEKSGQLGAVWHLRSIIEELKQDQEQVAN